MVERQPAGLPVEERDADIEPAVAGAMIAKFRSGGQACTAANRFYVHRDALEEFTSVFGAAVEALRVGPASDPDSQVGPLISDRARDGVRALVDAAILTVEIFGPVAPIVAWYDEEQLLAQVNDTESGLAAYVYSGRLQDALRLAERIGAGMIGVNRGIVSDPSAPFGGLKQSGLGREGAREGIREFCETQYFAVDWSGPSHARATDTCSPGEELQVDRPGMLN